MREVLTNIIYCSFLLEYRRRAIISRSFYIFLPHLIFTAVYNQVRLILHNLCTKQENSSIKSAVCNQERVTMVRVR